MPLALVAFLHIISQPASSEQDREFIGELVQRREQALVRAEEILRRLSADNSRYLSDMQEFVVDRPRWRPVVGTNIAGALTSVLAIQVEDFSTTCVAGALLSVGAGLAAREIGRFRDTRWFFNHDIRFRQDHVWSYILASIPETSVWTNAVRNRYLYTTSPKIILSSIDDLSSPFSVEENRRDRMHEFWTRLQRPLNFGGEPRWLTTHQERILNKWTDHTSGLLDATHFIEIAAIATEYIRRLDPEYHFKNGHALVQLDSVRTEYTIVKAVVRACN